MKNHRRTFLKAAGLAGVAIAASGAGRAGRPGIVMSAAHAASSQSGELPKGMTFAMLRRTDGYGLGVRTERGILDVVAAEKDFAAGAPTTITAVLNGTGDWQKLRFLVDQAKASSSGDRYFIAEEKAAFAPCVTNPEKIVCIGLNYRRHAAETGQPVPKLPILFNKYNSALNCCGGTVAVSREKATQFDYETELVIVMGRTARNVSEADALTTFSAIAPATISPPAICSRDPPNGCSARPWTAQVSSVLGLSPRTRSTETI
jgi:Fumarylacetoacetate (FAA) hydrolase family